MEEQYDYFEAFEPNRSKVGQAVPREELARRLAYQLQVPQRYGARLIAAYEAVIHDALDYGEGFRFKDLGMLTLYKFPSEMYKGLNSKGDYGEHRRFVMYKYKWKTFDSAKQALIDRTKREREMDDSIQTSDDT